MNDKILFSLCMSNYLKQQRKERILLAVIVGFGMAIAFVIFEATA